jgi:hypothetical protein
MIVVLLELRKAITLLLQGVNPRTAYIRVLRKYRILVVEVVSWVNNYSKAGYSMLTSVSLFTAGNEQISN